MLRRFFRPCNLRLLKFLATTWHLQSGTPGICFTKQVIYTVHLSKLKSAPPQYSKWISSWLVQTGGIIYHYITNPNMALRGNPSRLPYICIVWSSPSGWFNDPCQIKTMTSPRSQAPQLSLATSCNHSAGGDFHHGSSQMADGSEICWAAADRENLSPIFGKVYISYISAVVGSTFSCCSLSNVVDFKLVWPSNRICLWRQLQTFMKVPIQNFY